MANKVLSVYVGNDAIRIAEMQTNKNKSVILCNAAEVKTPENCVNDGYLVDVSAVAEAIRSSIFGRGFTAKEVIFTIQSKKIASKDIEVDYVKNDNTLQSLLYANSSEYFPMSNQNDYTFAFSRLEDFNDTDGKKSRISAVAAPNDIAKSYQELARELKLTVKAIDFFGNSIIQLLQMQMTENEVDMVLQIEKDATYVNIMRGKTLILQRSVPYGKNAVVNSMMDVKKISEKDANTLLSNETLLDQHVTADEYAAAVQYLVNGVGRIVEYHRGKNKSDVLQGIKIFGEGSAIAGIDKILEREMGAPVKRFDSLTGVQVRGQASLTAEQVLRYLPNIGAVINPMDLAVYEKKQKSGVNTELTFKVLVVLLIVAILGMGGWSGYTYYQYTKAVEARDYVQSQIDDIADIEEIANAYEEANGKHQIIVDFEASTRSDNELLLRLFDDMEVIMPHKEYINELTAEDGSVIMELSSGWQLTTKNEIADVIVQLNSLDYVHDFKVLEFTESYKNLFVTGYTDDGTPIYLREESSVPDELGELIEYEEGDDIEPEYEGYPIQQVVHTTYEVTFKLSDVPAEVPVEEAEEVVEDGTESTEEVAE